MHTHLYIFSYRESNPPELPGDVAAAAAAAAAVWVLPH